MKRVLLADEHACSRQCLRLALEREAGLLVVGEVAAGAQAIEMCERLKPDVLLLDLALPDGGGVAVMRALRARDLGVSVLLHTGASDQRLLLEAVRCGPHGFVEKRAELRMLCDALRVVAGGGKFYTPMGQQLLLDAVQEGERPAPLSPREMEVLGLLAAGRSGKAVAAMLHISARTVENHRAHIMQKLACADITALTRYAVRHRLVEGE
jgi:DNA-binding NarL/FixJ family response regulator